MSKAARNSGLTSKAVQGFGIGGQLARHHLDRDAPVETKLPRLVDCSHTTMAEQPLDPMGAVENGADQ